MRWLKVVAALTLLLVGLLALPARRITDLEMSPALQPADLVWVLPVPPLRGDLVVLRDPLDPGRRVVRRTLAGGGAKVSWDENGVRVDSKRIRQTDMGMLEGDRLMKEVLWSKPPARAREWLVRLRKPPAPYLSEAVLVPEGHWYLLADDRDRALDSRWWGPVPEQAIEGVIRLRVGAPDAWRSWASLEQGWE